MGQERELGKQYCQMLNEYEKQAIGENNWRQVKGDYCVKDNLIGKLVFWIASLYSEYKGGHCRPYYFELSELSQIEMVREFFEFTKIIDKIS